MSLTAVVRVDATSGVPSVLLSTDTLTADAVLTLTRDPAGPAGALVRGTPAVLDVGGALVLVDRECPVTGGALRYTLTVQDPATGATVETVSRTVTLPAMPGGGHVLSDPVAGVDVVVPVVDQTDQRAAWSGTVLPRAGVAAPVVVSGARQSWAWTLVVGTATVAQHDQLDRLLRAGDGPVLLIRHTDADCALLDGWVTVFDVDVDRVSVRGSDPRRRWTLPVQTVDAPASTVRAAGATLLDMHEYEPTTLGALATRAPTLRELALAVEAAV